MKIIGNKLDFIAAKYEAALEANAEKTAGFVKNYSQYMGSRDVDGSYVRAKVVRNVTRELIEGQVDSRIPFAKVTSQCIDELHSKNARSIERLCDYYVKKLNFAVLNDVDERQTYVFGSSVWLIEFAGFDGEGGCGEIDVRVIHPKFFTPQPGVARIEDMDYCFIDLPLPREEIERRYGVDLSDVEGDLAVDDEDYFAGGRDGEIVMLHVCFYRNSEGDVCEYAWTDDKEIFCIDDYYGRSAFYCSHCGRRAELCEEDPCSYPSYLRKTDEGETLEKDVLDADGNLLIPAFTDGGEGRRRTVLPFYKPKCFPIVIRKNTSALDGDWCGISDCDVIRDQQQVINKLESRAFEKSMRSGTMVAIPYDALIDAVDNSIYDKVVKLKPHQSLSQFGVINTEVSAVQDINQSERNYEAAKKISGITNSYTGQADSTATSGKAKQVQIQQAAGRLESKRVMKKACYADLYKIIFELALAYMDRERPLCDSDGMGGDCVIHFNRYAFYKFDKSLGRWVIDSDYLFEADFSVTPEDSRESMWELNMVNFEKGMFGDPSTAEAKLRYWLKQERAMYPDAYEEVKYCRRLLLNGNLFEKGDNVEWDGRAITPIR